MDETGLFYVMPSSKGLSSMPNANGMKTSKMRLTYAFTCNADGSERLVPFVIGKAFKPRCFGKQLGFYYRHNAIAWMTCEFFTEWIIDWDRVCREKGRKIILLVDNFAVQTCQKTLTHITIERFEPNMTSHVQPIDAGIIACSKAHYRALFHRRAISRYDNKIPIELIFGINQLEAIRLAEIAWHMVTVATLANCIRKTGILPVESSSSENTESESLQDIIQESIDDLINAGLLATAQRPSGFDLLNPCNEHENVIGTISDETIVEAVKEAHVQSLGGSAIEEDSESCRVPSNAEADDKN